MCFYYGKMERAEENGEEDVSQHMKKISRWSGKATEHSMGLKLSLLPSISLSLPL